MKLIFALLQQMSVFLVIAYLFSKSPAFRPLTGEILRDRHKILLYFLFSGSSITGYNYNFCSPWLDQNMGGRVL
jgi:two-component system LytT family sensor kinase